MHNENGFTPSKSQLRYARTLKITADQPYYSQPRNSHRLGPNQKKHPDLKTLFMRWYKKPLKDLKDVVSMLDNVTSVRWIIPDILSNPCALPHTSYLDFTSILKIVASLPSLDTFSFDVSHPLHLVQLLRTRFGLEHLHSLKSFSLTQVITIQSLKICPLTLLLSARVCFWSIFCNASQLRNRSS
ncbi:hypothetical protein BT96DRAFT_577449 [Gymnopus androsaceus JB14]|uniref:Uncharacterized protein n=1 Tax=Gymnopus androsaceus JB14 TaxID=1447944 RepID=A0A6A4HY46_9AGAR|nr:hypothetical protein BT96DRAFT_577449 [Gymnopus androsaceus JB14]